MKTLILVYSLYKDGTQKRKELLVNNDAEPNILAAIHRPVFGTVHGIFDTKGNLLYSDDQNNTGSNDTTG